MKFFALISPSIGIYF